jgi:Lecithin retinol acyltransferase
MDLPDLPDLRLGAHLTSPRWGYVHHGLYAGAGRVIHYGGFDRAFRRGPIEEVCIESFAGGHGLQVKAWAAPKFAGETAIARARARLGEDRYSLFSNNCEHFAHWCISGVSRSEQVESWTVWPRAALRRLRSLRVPGGRAATA